MRQIIAIHGGDAFATYEEYLTYLRDYKIENVDYFRPKKSWKLNLQDSLGADYDVLLPRMPNSNNARYAEWKLWFEKLLPFVEDGAILIGHSLGGSFLTRYLAEEKFPKKIAATFLIAANYGVTSDGMSLEFAAPGTLALFAQQGGKLFLYHSTDDPVVPFSEITKYQAALPSATTRVFSNRQHFNQETFPELVADIKSL